MIVKICTIVALSALFNYGLADDTILDTVHKGFENLGEAIGSTIHKATDAVKNTASSSRDGISHQIDNVKDTASSVKGSMSDGIDTIKDHMHEAKDKVEDTGESFLDTIGRHANQAAKKIKEAAHAVGEKFGEATDYIGEKIGVIKPKSEEAEKSIMETFSGLRGEEMEKEQSHRSRLVYHHESDSSS